VTREHEGEPAVEEYCGGGADDDEHELVLSLISDLNDRFSTGLSVEPIMDRFLDEEVFEPDAEPKKRLLTSHLTRIAEQLDADKWEVINLCSGGFRINNYNEAEITAKDDTLKGDESLDDHSDRSAVR
jgi:hypothetical protein